MRERGCPANVFLPRDAMRKRGLSCRPVSVRPSVRLSRWCIVSTRLKISSYFFLSPVAHHSTFLFPSTGTQFQGYPFRVGIKYAGWENLAIFDQNRRLSRKLYAIGPWLLWNVNSKSYWRIDLCRFRWPSVTPNPGFKVTVYLKSNISKTMRPRDKVTIAH